MQCFATDCNQSMVFLRCNSIIVFQETAAPSWLAVVNLGVAVLGRVAALAAEGFGLLVEVGGVHCFDSLAFVGGRIFSRRQNRLAK